MLVSKILTSIALAFLGGGANSGIPSQQIDVVVTPPAIEQGVPTETGKAGDSDIVEEVKADSIETKQEIEKEEVPFLQEKQNDSTLLQGETKIKQEGRVGVREKIYTITYTNGAETNKELTSNKVIQEPVHEITSVGTKSPVVTPPKSSGKGYINVDGDFVKSPGSDPAGASAKCRDGSYSYSANRRGTCSGHGGVASWL